jgi:hypothetical protein
MECFGLGLVTLGWGGDRLCNEGVRMTARLGLIQVAAWVPDA